MKPIIVAFAGRIGSGKSTVAQAVAAALDWPCAGFGDYVRQVTRQRQLPETRESWQAVGEDLISTGWNEFCRAVLLSGGWRPGHGTVVEGVRHLEALQNLREVAAPLEVRLVFIEIDEAARQERLQRRGDAAEKRQHEVEAHSTEAQVPEILATRAALIISGDGEITTLRDRVVAWLQDEQSESK